MSAAKKQTKKASRAELLDLLFELVSSERCRYDHHGGCQAHGFLSLEDGMTCPHADAARILFAEGRGFMFEDER